MDLKTRVKNFTQVQLIEALLNLLSRFSNKNLIKITYMVESLADTDWTKRQIKAIRKYFQEGHPAVELAPVPINDNLGIPLCSALMMMAIG